MVKFTPEELLEVKTSLLRIEAMGPFRRSPPDDFDSRIAFLMQLSNRPYVNPGSF